MWYRFTPEKDKQMKWTSLNDLREKYLSFFESKGLSVEILLSDELPQADPVSGKFKHVYKGF